MCSVLRVTEGSCGSTGGLLLEDQDRRERDTFWKRAPFHDLSTGWGKNHKVHSSQDSPVIGNGSLSFYVEFVDVGRQDNFRNKQNKQQYFKGAHSPRKPSSRYSVLAPLADLRRRLAFWGNDERQSPREHVTKPCVTNAERPISSLGTPRREAGGCNKSRNKEDYIPRGNFTQHAGLIIRSDPGSRIMSVMFVKR